MLKRHPIPQGLSFFSPIVLVASFGGSGLLRPASGTWGSLASLPFGVFLLLNTNNLTLFISSIALCLIGVWATHYWLAHDTDKDPSAVVIDEAAGQWLTLSFVPHDMVTPLTVLAAFLLFRFFDIVKPWPVSHADKNIKGAWGVMLDDMIAGIMAGIVLYYGWRFLNV